MNSDKKQTFQTVSAWRDILKSAGILFSGEATGRLCMIAYRYINLRLLTPEEYGKLCLVISLFTSLIMLAHFNASTALTKYLSDRHNTQKRSIYTSSALILVLLTSISSSIIMIIYVKHLGLLTPILMTFIILGFITFSFSCTLSGALKGLFYMKWSALVDASNSFVRLALLILFMIIIGRELFFSLIAYFASGVFALGLAYIMIRKRKIAIKITAVSKKALKDIIGYSSFLSLSAFLLGMMWFSLRWMLSLQSLKGVAIFDTGFLIYSVLQMGFASAVVALVPHVSRMSGQNSKLPKLPAFRKIVKIYLVVIPILFLVWITKIDLILLQHIGLLTYRDSLPVFYIVFLAAPFDLSFGLSSGILQGLGKTKQLFFTIITVLPIHIIGGYILCNLLGTNGAALMVVITFLFLWSLNMKKVRKYVHGGSI